MLSRLPHTDLLQLLGLTQYSDHPSYAPVQPILPTLSCNSTLHESLLDYTSMAMLVSCIPYQRRTDTKQLYSSRLHGESFAALTECILNKGPTLIVVKDTQGYVFGGYANQPWKISPNFTGDGNCFLFTVSPKFEVFNRPTSYNTHYMYFQLNVETMPTGLGMGGQLDYFGLWLSSDFGTGHSKAKPKCSTYASTQLSGEEEFKVFQLEVWGFGDTHSDKKHEKSALDKERDARAILEMVGKVRHSDGLREPEDSD